jgi:hypothetical protein
VQLTRRSAVSLICISILSLGVLDAIFEIRKERVSSLLPAAPATVISVQAIASTLGFTTIPGNPASSFLAQLIPEKLRGNLEGTILLHRNDRAAEIASLSSNDADALFTKLKTNLYLAFSSDVNGIEDRAFRDSTGVAANVFVFSDPQLAEERVLFINKGASLLELHIAKGAEVTVGRLVQRILEM